MSNIYQTYTPPSDGGGFLKIEPGETVILRIAGEPVIFNNDYQGKTSTRYAWVVYNLNNKSAQIFAQSATFFRQLAAYAKDEDYGDPKNYNIKVTREGSGTETKYTIVPSPKKYALDADQLADVEQVDIIKAISAGTGVSNVFWLEDFANGKSNSAPAPSPVPETVKDTFEIDADSDEPIDLSEVPF